MNFKLTGLIGAAAMLVASAFSAQAQTTLKWAHVYETSEPFHTESVWAAEEIGNPVPSQMPVPDRERVIQRPLPPASAAP